MLRVLATALAVISLTTATLCFSAPNPPALTPGITLIGKGVVSGSALDTSGLAGNICQAGAPANCVPKAIFGGGPYKKFTDSNLSGRDSNDDALPIALIGKASKVSS